MTTNPRQYLNQNFKEDIPAWLANYKAWDRSTVTDFMKSRTVFYPGAALDGHPFKVFGASHAAHCFVYADYFFKKESVIDSLSPTSREKLHGYQLAFQHDLTTTDLVPVDWHLNAWYHTSHAAWMRRPPLEGTVEPWGVLCIFDRENRYGDSHGPERLALIYLGADGIATYRALYCQTGCRAPYGLLLQDHGFGGNYNRFGGGGLMEKIAIETHVFPRWMLSDRGNWTGFERVPSVDGSVGGMYDRERFLFRHQFPQLILL